MNKNIKFTWKTFNELSLDDLYAILNLRQKVFVLEQDCAYIDADFSDQDAFHFLAYEDNNLIAYLRAFKPGIKYEGSSLGRIVTEINSRGLGIGKKITIESTAEIETNKLVIIWQYLSPINFPKKPEIIDAIKGKNKIRYSILSF